MIVDVVQDFVDRDAPPWLSSDRIAELASVEFFAPSIFTYSYSRCLPLGSAHCVPLNSRLT